MNDAPGDKIARDLRSFCAESDDARRLFNVFSQRLKDARLTKVERAAWLAGVDYSAMVRVLKRLDQIGVGKYISGRHGHASRMEWKFSIRSLATVALGQGRKLEGVAPDADTDDINDGAEKSQTVEHEYLLRPNLKAVIKLPTDLTQKEVTRLSAYLQTLVM